MKILVNEDSLCNPVNYREIPTVSYKVQARFPRRVGRIVIAPRGGCATWRVILNIV